MIKYFIVKTWKKFGDEWYSKDIQFNDIQELIKYISDNKLFKIELRVVYEQSKDVAVTCVK